MPGICEQIKLALPPRKIPIGKLVVSDDNEFLIVFKDSIGVFIPNLKLANEMQMDSTDLIGSRMKFFTLLESNQLNLPISFDPSNVRCSHEIARYALTYCERSAIIMSTKVLESKEFLSYAFKNADWSPSGVDQMSRSVFSCVTGTCQLLVCLRDLDKWTCVANISNLWNAFWRTQGLRILAGELQDFLNLSDNEQLNSNHSAGLSVVPLKCRSVKEFLSSIAEYSFTISTWSRRFRRSEQRITHNNCLLTALHKSGTISFWDVAVPIVDEGSIRLSAVDRTYAVKFEPPNLRAKPNFIKIVDIGGEKFLLVVAFTDSRIVCVTYQAYAKRVGVISIKRLSDSELCPCSCGFISVSDATYSDDILAIAYGTRVLLAKVLNQTTVRLLICLSDDAILKAISGVCFFNNHVYFSSQDGIIAKASVPTQLNKSYHLTILNKASTLGGKNFHRFFGGLHLTQNGVYASFVESTLAPAFCNITSNLVFLVLLSNSEVVDLIDGLSAPMRRNVDCLYQVTRLLRSTEYNKSVSLECSDVDMDLETWSQKLQAFCRGAFFDTKTDLSKLELHKIQFRRAVAAILVEGSNKSSEMKEMLQTQIDRLDKILALRQIDLCYRLFLKTEVQRQSQDCILVLRIAALCRRFLQGDAAKDCGMAALCSMLHRATEAVTGVAQKLLIKRFEQTLDNVSTTALLVCPVCRTDILFDCLFYKNLLVAACSRGHEFMRCASTFIPCVESCFSECPSCRRCSVLLPDRPSQWRREINGRFCPYCNAGAKVEPGHESSNFANRLKFMRRIRKSDKRRPNTISIHSNIATDTFLKENDLYFDILESRSTGFQEKFTKSLTDENDALRNKNIMLRYQVELFSEQLSDLRDVNMDLRNQNSRIREENSILRNEQTQLSARNDCLVEQIIVLQKMLEDMGVSVDDTSGYHLEEVDATETPGDDVDGDDGTSCNGNHGTPASYRKPPLHCDKNLDFL
uniref:Gtpase activating protein gyp2 n=1 Tax=Echinococcus granulosus TaxID=6210 RepID=A0A068WPZ6_ECHGR|nr:gtpase activating protein gyp2 [Echinococcus granulosus]